MYNTNPSKKQTENTILRQKKAADANTALNAENAENISPKEKKIKFSEPNIFDCNGKNFSHNYFQPLCLFLKLWE